MIRKIHMPLIMVLVLAGTWACFEEDTLVPGHAPGDEQAFAFEESIYTTQSFFDLGENRIVAENENGDWVLRFGSQAGDWHIGVNSAEYWAAYSSMTSDPDSVPLKPGQEEWVFDRSSGDPDSTAFAGWISFIGGDTLYSNHIYLLGKYDGIGYSAEKAIQFLSVNAEVYVCRIMDWPSGDWDRLEIPKDPSFNYRYLALSGDGGAVQIEPERNAWDLQFTQYGSILYTNEGVPTPYYVRGVLLNRNGVAAALDSVRGFAGITYEDIPGYEFSQREDAIGYGWKSVEVDVNSNTAVYEVKAGYTYIIRDTEGFYHKLRFIGYYNDLGEKGYPVLEHVRL